MVRLLEKYKNEIVPSLMGDGKFKNVMMVPNFSKVILNMGLGGALKNEAELTEATQDMALITGQKAKICRARKSVATWRLREGQPIGCKVTLRNQRMWEFLDRLINLAIPRIKDFRGLNPKSFDGRGNYSMGVTEKAIFPEVRQDKMQYRQGLDVTVVTTAKTDQEALELMKFIGFPFKG